MNLSEPEAFNKMFEPIRKVLLDLQSGSDRKDKWQILLDLCLKESEKAWRSEQGGRETV